MGRFTNRFTRRNAVFAMVKPSGADLELIRVVPEFVAPDNNGAAYEKCIAMYRDLSGIGDAADTVPAEGIDQQV